jgi:hypothetical protein
MYNKYNMKKIKLMGKKEIYVIVDNLFYNEFIKYNWYFTSGYASRSEWNPKTKKGKTIYMHRLVADTPEGKQTDHINRNKLDNRKKNLRICTNKQNSGNIALSKHNTSGAKGVNFHHKRWRAFISDKNKHVHLGYFSTKELAIKAYNTKAQELFGSFALLNKL